jgi:hypothetical protein
VDQIHEAMSQISWKVRAEVRTAIFSKAPCYEDLGKSISHSQLYVGIRLVIPQQNVEVMYSTSTASRIKVPVLALAWEASRKYERTRARRFFALPT